MSSSPPMSVTMVQSKAAHFLDGVHGKDPEQHCYTVWGLGCVGTFLAVPPQLSYKRITALVGGRDLLCRLFSWNWA